MNGYGIPALQFARHDHTLVFRYTPTLERLLTLLAGGLAFYWFLTTVFRWGSFLGFVPFVLLATYVATCPNVTASFDTLNRTIIIVRRRMLWRTQTPEIPFAAVRSIDLSEESGEGTTYSIRLMLDNGKSQILAANMTSRARASRAVERIARETGLNRT
jgi:hypothetical protein